MSNPITPSELLAFQEAMRGKKGDFDSWLECNNEAEVIAYINAHAATVSAADNAALREHLGNLLAVLHGDGGHYEAEHGTDKAVADALTRFYSNIMAADSKITAKDARIKVLEDALENIADITAKETIHKIARAALGDKHD